MSLIKKISLFCIGAVALYSSFTVLKSKYNKHYLKQQFQTNLKATILPLIKDIFECRKDGIKVPSNVEETVNTVLKYFAHKELPIENGEESRKFFANFSVKLVAKLKDKNNDDELLGKLLFSTKLLVLYPSDFIKKEDFQRYKYEYDHVNALYNRARCLDKVKIVTIKKDFDQMLDAVSMIDRLNETSGETCSRNFYFSYPMLKFLCMSGTFANGIDFGDVANSYITKWSIPRAIIGIAAKAANRGLLWLTEQQVSQLQKVISEKRNEVDAMKEEIEEKFSKHYKNELKDLPSFQYVIENFIERMVEICYSKQAVENISKRQQDINNFEISFANINWNDFPEKKKLSKFTDDLFKAVKYTYVPKLIKEMENNR